MAPIYHNSKCTPIVSGWGYECIWVSIPNQLGVKLLYYIYCLRPKTKKLNSSLHGVSNQQKKSFTGELLL